MIADIAGSWVNTYSLRIEEINLSNEKDFYHTPVVVHLHHLCKMCSISPESLEIQVDKMDLETLRVPFTLQSFGVKPK